MYNINRRKFLSFFGCSCCALALPSCSTVPITDRKQLSIIPESRINQQAASAYEKFKSKAKLITSGSQLNEVRDIGKKMEIRDDLIAGQLKNHEVVFMQEVFRYVNERAIRNSMQASFPYVSDKLTDNGSNTYDGGVLTFSKYPIVDQAQYVFENCKGTDCAADKGVIYTKIITKMFQF